MRHNARTRQQIEVIRCKKVVTKHNIRHQKRCIFIGHRLSKKGRINTRVFLQIVILRKFYTAEKTRKTREKWEIAFVLLSSIYEFDRGQPIISELPLLLSVLS